MARSPLVLVLALVLSVALSADAWANCNAIPDAESAMVSGHRETAGYHPMMAPPAPGTGPIGFKGALGRMDRFALLPGQPAVFRIQPDGQCVQASEGRLTVRNVPGGPGVLSDPVVSLFTRPADDGPIEVVTLSGRQKCDDLVAVSKHRMGETKIQLECAALPPKIDPQEDKRTNVRVELPRDLRLRGPATVLLTNAQQNSNHLLDLISKIAVGGCAGNCEELVNYDARACIDHFYAVLEHGVVIHDQIPCEVIIPGCSSSDPACANPTIMQNDFHALCDDLPNQPADLAQCADASPTPPDAALDLWEDSCGGVHIPFDWSKIRKDNSTTPPTDITRVVAGRSATARTTKGSDKHSSNKKEDERTWIPGREFMGSTPWAGPQGTAATTDWRKPEIDVWYSEDFPHEIGLRGSTDGPDSIVHVYPRMPVSIVCKNSPDDEGCMAVTGHGGVSCACRDRYPADCECHVVGPPKYFACENGEFDWMPCTRHDHCNSKFGSSIPDGTCTRQPRCMKDDRTGIWGYPGPPPTVGDPCWSDEGCKDDPNRQCGYRLFDLGDRKNDTPSKPNLIVLDKEIPHSPGPGNRVRRGACKGDRKEVCTTATKSCAPDDQPCLGLTLRAEGKRP